MADHPLHPAPRHRDNRTSGGEAFERDQTEPVDRPRHRQGKDAAAIDFVSGALTAHELTVELVKLRDPARQNTRRFTRRPTPLWTGSCGLPAWALVTASAKKRALALRGDGEPIDS